MLGALCWALTLTPFLAVSAIPKTLTRDATGSSQAPNPEFILEKRSTPPLNSTALDSLAASENQCTDSPFWYTTGLHPTEFEADCYAAAQQLFLQDVHYGHPDEMYETITPWGSQVTTLPLLKNPRLYTVGKPCRELTAIESLDS